MSLYVHAAICQGFEEILPEQCTEKRKKGGNSRSLQLWSGPKICTDGQDMGEENGKMKRKVEPGAGVSQVLSLGAMGVNKVRADGISWRS